MKATDVLVQCLENEGVEYVFGIPGTEILDLVHSLSKSNIQFILVRHEQGAAFMADLYGRLSKKPGVCLATLGPGATNLLTGISSAQLDHSPVIALVGQVSSEKQHPESHQYLNLTEIYKPATKWSTQIKSAQMIPVTIRKAFRTAMMEKPGAVLLALPENLATEMIAGQPLALSQIPPSLPVQKAIQTAHSIIQDYMKPFILIGNGVIRENATEELRIFIDALQSPVAHSFMAKGILPKNHPSNYFTFGFSENDKVLAGIAEADLLIVIGFDFVEQLPQKWNGGKNPVIHIDTLPAEINEYYPAEIELTGNIKQILHALNQLKMPPKSWVPQGNLKEKIKTSYQIRDHQGESNRLPLTTENILLMIEELVPDQSIIISDVGAHKLSIARTYQPKQPDKLIISNGLASMGIALPGAIGAKLACPEDPVICITGDGGALMNFAEIETAKRLGVSFIMIVLNDSVLKLEEMKMEKMFESSEGVSFQNPDFIQLAEGYGIKSGRAHNLRQFVEHLREALLVQSQGEIMLIDVLLPSSP